MHGLNKNKYFKKIIAIKLLIVYLYDKIFINIFIFKYFNWKLKSKKSILIKMFYDKLFYLLINKKFNL